jgi:PhnB protein
MTEVNPYVTFDGDCEEAINFYKSNLGAVVLFTQRYGESPMKGTGPDDKIMHCTIKIGDSTIMACDNMSAKHPTTVGNNVSLAVGMNDARQAEEMFKKMSAGGTITMPMQKTFWAELFGVLTDKFGITWMFNVGKPGADS